MASFFKHRKLFPANQTACPDVCYSDCPSYCYPYSYLYYPPPPSPLPVPPPPPSLVYADTNDPQNHPISPYMILLISVLVSFFLLVSYYAVVAKNCIGCCRSRTENQPQAPQQDRNNEGFFDENRVDHPIWFITTVGLQQSLINLITVCKYKRGEGLIEGTECSVCLSEFQEGETLRLLPKCSHAFHRPCIDTWLRSHINCPLCRAHIMSDNSSSRLPLAAVSQNNGGNRGRIEETQMENSDINVELSENRGRNTGITENIAGTEDETEALQASCRRISKERMCVAGHESQQSEFLAGDEQEQARRQVLVDSSSSSTATIPGQVNVSHDECEGSLDNKSNA